MRTQWFRVLPILVVRPQPTQQSPLPFATSFRLDECRIRNVYFESPGTAQEWLYMATLSSQFCPKAI